jgi:hypothetical protein
MNALFPSLQSAAELVVRQEGYSRSELVLAHWATTYRTSVDDVVDALNIAENGSRRLPEEIASPAKPIPQNEEGEE